VMPKTVILLQQNANPTLNPQITTTNSSDSNGVDGLQSKTMTQVLSQLQSGTSVIETRIANEDKQLLQDARVVSHQIEHNRKHQHFLTEHHKNEQLKAVYTDFMQWVDQMTAESSGPQHQAAPQNSEDPEDTSSSE